MPKTVSGREFNTQLRPPFAALQRDGDRKPNPRISAIVQVVAVVVVDINVVGRVPVLSPRSRPWVQNHERKSAVGKARIPHVHRWQTTHAKPVPVSKREIEACLRNVEPAVAPTLPPIAMVASPILGSPLLPRIMSLPGAVLRPAPLLLPRRCLLPAALRLLLLPCLLSPLLRLRSLLLGLLNSLLRPLLGGLCPLLLLRPRLPGLLNLALLLRPLLLDLSPRLLLLLQGVLLRCGSLRRGMLLLGLGRFFFPLPALCVGREDHSE